MSEIDLLRHHGLLFPLLHRLIIVLQELVLIVYVPQIPACSRHSPITIAIPRNSHIVH